MTDVTEPTARATAVMRSSVRARATCTRWASSTRVLLGGRACRPGRRARSEDLFIVAVQCGQAGGTCFCVSMGTGPVADARFRPRAHRDPGRRRPPVHGRGRLRAGRRGPGRSPASRGLARRTAQMATSVHERTASQMGRELDTDGIKELLYRNYEHPRWDEVADRCLLVRQLHDGLPDLLLHDGRGHNRSRRRARRAPPALGLVLHGRLLPYPRRRGPRLDALALPAVDDPQACDLVGSVRQLGVRRLRAMHHLVSGRDRPHRGGACDPSDAEGAIRMRTIDS